MKKTEVTLDESYIADQGDKWPAADYPFYEADGGQRMIFCEPCDNFTGLIDTRTYRGGERECRGIIAVCEGNKGLFASYTADQLRVLGKQLFLMANAVDEENGK